MYVIYSCDGVVYVETEKCRPHEGYSSSREAVDHTYYTLGGSSLLFDRNVGTPIMANHSMYFPLSKDCKLV